MDPIASKQLEHLRQAFGDAASAWPGLHHAFIQVDILAACTAGTVDLNFFLGAYPRVILAPLVGRRVILECLPSLHDSLATVECSRSRANTPFLNIPSGLLGFSAFYDDAPGDKRAIQRFQELALAASRCQFRLAGDLAESAYGHNHLLPDKWLGELYMLGLENADAILHVREHRLEVSDDGSEFRLVPGYSGPMPAGDAVGVNGRHRPWQDLLRDVARFGLGVDVLESGVFTASAYAIDFFLNKRKSSRESTTAQGRVLRTKGRKRAPRTPKLTDKQQEARDYFDREKTYTGVGQAMGITRQAATELVKRGRKNCDAIRAAVMKAGNATGASVRADKRLPQDRRGQVSLSDDE